MRITSKGQVTIPLELRRKAGLMPHMEVEFSYEEGRIVLRKADTQPDRGRMAVERLRASKPRTTLSTDEILALTRGEADA
ncbi:AbrB/MazE/SpoVT family DNA-binding domain-containing protein [Thioalkalivibrio sulfidiphilus]|uniref:AbrB/MazE/SpoVT family DNA-binding domain-containing protein n=1 Tax=Thioalkalivibrio sulfidiphilus TaxID=1033854 RepID=UPI00037920AB|nr:AbrB/MazE/SpoVT family DNA-binding domain-containing protein [Thioalkalivibrio sulfidiphilus]